MLSVVIPCRNEEGSLGRYEAELYPALDALGESYEIIAVDDGSSDGTRAALEALSRRKPLRLLIHERNRGLGAALRTGFSAARGDWIAALDADLTFHPRHLAALLARQRETGADLVAGAPFEARDSSVPWPLRLPSLMINAFYRGLFAHSFSSYTPMFRLYRKAALSTIDLKSEDFQISAEIAARFIKKGFRLAETPVPLTTRREGSSKLRRWRELKHHAALIVRLLVLS